MPEAKFRPDDNLEITVEAKSQKDLFWGLAEVQEVFGKEPCMICGNKDTKFFVRTVKNDDGEFEFPERKCNSPKCNASLSYSLNKKGGTMYPVRKTTEGKWDNQFKGWKKFVPGQYDKAPVEE